MTETWLHLYITDGVIDSEGQYHVCSCDRPNKNDGGVCILINKRFNVINVHVMPNIEVVCVDVECGPSRFRLIAIYRPPGYNLESNVYAVNLVNCLESLFNTATPIFVTGELTCPSIEWFN